MSIKNDQKKKKLKKNFLPNSLKKKDFSNHAVDRLRERLPFCNFSITIQGLKEKIEKGEATKKYVSGRRFKIEFENEGNFYYVIIDKKFKKIITVGKNSTN